MKDRYENLDEYIADLRAALSQNDGCANHHYNCLLYTSPSPRD